MIVTRLHRQIWVFRSPVMKWAFFCYGCDNAWTDMDSVGHNAPGEAADAGRRHWQRVHYVR